MANITGIPTDAYDGPAEVDTSCVSCGRPAVAFPKLKLVEQVAAGAVRWAALVVTHGVVFSWDCQDCGFQNDLLEA